MYLNNVSRLSLYVYLQWFGNLVTPQWWDDLWLNEGFATFVEYLGIDHYHPDWNVVSNIDHYHPDWNMVSVRVCACVCVCAYARVCVCVLANARVHVFSCVFMSVWCLYISIEMKLT
jgi:hypothetical protein